MNLPEPQITADGCLILPGGAGPLAEAFARSPADGMLMLSLDPLPGSAGPLLAFYHAAGRGLLQGILRSGGSSVLPGEPECAALLESLPPVSRGEIPSPGFFAALLRETAELASLSAQREGKTVCEWIRDRVPAWKEIGRIVFHLAENRKDVSGSRPFAFLATYPDRTGENGTVRHIPLASALKLYAGSPETLLALLAPVRRAAEESPFLAGLLADRSLFKPCLWGPHEAFLFVRDIEIFRRAGLSVRLQQQEKRPARLKLRLTLESPAPKKGVPVTETLLRFSAAAAVGDRVLTQEELDAVLKTGGGLIRIKGEWVEADAGRVGDLLRKWREAEQFAGDAGIPFLAGLRILAGFRTGAGPLPPLPEDIAEVSAGPDLSRLLSGGFRNVSVPPPPEEIPLRPYQKEGAEWLYRMGELGMGACLSDDMGLGKTVQVLACLEMLRREKAFASLPALAVVPASLLGSWRSECARFTPGLRAAVLHPSDEDAMKSFRENAEGFLHRHDLVITSYGMAVRLGSGLEKFVFPLLLLDEAQNIKNASSEQSLACRKLKGKRRIALTGTPVENSAADLWSLFDFLTPGLLGAAEPFRKKVRDMELSGGYGPLRRLVRPCILRRLKTDRRIASDLPAKTEVREWCFLSPAQLALYQRAVGEMRKELELADEKRRGGVILSFLMQFKQICNHPTQFTGLGDYSAERSGKFQRLFSLAEQFALRGDRVLVFTQFREIMDPLRALLARAFGRDGLVLHGGVPPAERTRMVEMFQKPSGPPFFLLSLRAAGTGLTLTAANQVVHFDRWWNPAVENQATDRACRIGQRRNVLVHKFVCRGTLEEKIDAVLAGKARLSRDILSGGAEKLLTGMSDRELLDFVRAGFTSGD